MQTWPEASKPQTARFADGSHVAVVFPADPADLATVLTYVVDSRLSALAMRLVISQHGRRATGSADVISTTAVSIA